MKRTILAIVTALLLGVSLASVASAADGAVPAGTEPTPVAEPSTAPEPSATPFDGNGEVVIDPTFITPTAEPHGQVLGATGRPEATPPSTDAITAATTSGTGLHVLLVLGVAGSLLALLAVRVPPARRR